MNWKAALAHVLICAALGGVVAMLTEVKWVPASLWLSAALFFNGSLAFFEDAQPGGFDNPSNSEALPIAKGMGALKFWVGSLTICFALVAAGFFLQFRP